MCTVTFPSGWSAFQLCDREVQLFLLLCFHLFSQLALEQKWCCKKSRPPSSNSPTVITAQISMCFWLVVTETLMDGSFKLQDVWQELRVACGLFLLVWAIIKFVTEKTLNSNQRKCLRQLDVKATWFYTGVNMKWHVYTLWNSLSPGSKYKTVS